MEAKTSAMEEAKMENSFEIEEHEILGAGGMGEVKLCTHLESGKKVACKIIAKRNLVKPENKAAVLREIKIGGLLGSNPHIVACRASYEDAFNVYMLMELCKGGSLLHYIYQRGRLPENEARLLFCQIVEAMKFCHHHNIMHRDLKPENILLTGETSFHVKLADFGLSEFIDSQDTFSKILGTPSYMAPEVLNGCYGAEIDVWSAGLVLYEMLSGVQMFPYNASLTELVDHIRYQIIDLDQLNVSEEAKDIIYRMLCRDPKQRPTFSQLSRHRWFWFSKHAQ